MVMRKATVVEAELIDRLAGGAKLEVGPLVRVTKDGKDVGWVRWRTVQSCLEAGWVAFSVNEFVATDLGRGVAP